MPSYVVKPDRDKDFYVYWSDVVEAPTAWGDRQWMAQHLAVDQQRGPQSLSVGERLSWADVNGTSARWPGGDAGYCYDWNDSGMIYEQQGWLRRHRLVELCERLNADAHADVSDLLEPFDDDPST